MATEQAIRIEAEQDKAGFIGRIPVRNLWLLMLYASDLFRHKGVGRVELEETDAELPDLIAEILINSVSQRLRKQLTTGYHQRQAVLSRVRGRINVLQTERHQLLSRGLVACKFEELTIDTPRNRFVKSALEIASSLVTRKELAQRCSSLALIMRERGVAGNPPTLAQISGERYGRHDADDRMMVDAAKLIFDLSIPTEIYGHQVMSLPDREVIWVRRLFERAIGGFFAHALGPTGWRIRCGATQKWQISEQSSGMQRLLPSMRTDIILDQALDGRRLVIDTKFNSIVSPGWFREETLRSGYIYQMYAYIRSQVGLGDLLADKALGLLLHPSVGIDVDEYVVIQGHKIRFSTVDLTASHSSIRTQLLRLIS